MKSTARLLSVLPAVGMLVLLLCFPAALARGVRAGLTLCGEALIPSLFPFFVLSSFFVRSGLNDAVGRRLGGVTRRVFRLPPAAAGAVLLGLCGGYPVGMRMTAQLHTAGKLTDEQSQRMSAFCVAAGPAFVIGAVGASMLSSRAAGRLLFAALTLSNLTVGFLLRFTGTDESNPAFPKPAQTVSVPRSFCDAVADAGEAVLRVAAWVLLFSGVREVCAKLPASAAVALGCVLEVTSGCRTAVRTGMPLPLTAAILGFGGFAVHCQILPDAVACHVRLSRFFVFRLVGAALSAFYCEVLLSVFPQASPAVLLRSGDRLLPFSASAPASAALLLVCAVFILQTTTPKKGHSRKVVR